MDRNQFAKLLAKQLARYYGSDIAPDRACACTGLSGNCLDCSMWWEQFLTVYTKSQIETMHDLFEMCSARLQSRQW
jgi:hypothetical protein